MVLQGRRWAAGSGGGRIYKNRPVVVPVRPGGGCCGGRKKGSGEGVGEEVVAASDTGTETGGMQQR